MLYVIYYHCSNSTEINIYSICDNIPNLLELIIKRFTIYRKNNNNNIHTYSCIDKIKNSYVNIWINTHEENTEIEYKWVSASSPQNTFEIPHFGINSKIKEIIDTSKNEIILK
jgi:sugar-specific transcriptional regulator TrmB